MKWIWTPLVAIVAALLLGCGSSSERSGGATAAASASGMCSIEHDGVVLTAWGGGSGACSGLAYEAAATGSYWSPGSGPGVTTVRCSMSKSGAILEVRVASGTIGDEAGAICANLLRRGWHEAEGPGQEQERAAAGSATTSSTEAQHEEQGARKDAERIYREALEREGKSP